MSNAFDWVGSRSLFLMKKFLCHFILLLMAKYRFLQTVSFLSNQAKIVMDPSVSNGYIGIDAIRLIGSIVAEGKHACVKII